MDAEELLRVLRENAAEIRSRFGVRHLLVFGSVATGEANKGSDLDVLVEFQGCATFQAVLDLADHLEALAARRVDLVTPKGMPPRLLAAIQREAVAVA